MVDFKNFKSTKEIKVSPKIIDQVIGQDEAVEVMKKAARQRRHVLLIGCPGTGKSMLGLGLAEMLPKEKLVDVLAFPNINDENLPLIRTVPAGKGRDLVAKARIQAMGMFRSQNLIMFILLILAMIAPWWARSYYKSDIIFAAFFLGGMMFLASFVLFMNLSRRVNDRVRIPKIVVDNYKRKQVPFMDATGAHAGALLGDVLHDPFQCFVNSNLYIKRDISLAFSLQSIQKTLDALFLRHKKDIIKNKKDYEAIFLGKNELFVFGETNGSIVPTEVLSCNKQYYNSKMIKLTTSTNKELIVTPGHKIAVNKNEKIAYVEAKNVEIGDEIISKAEDVIIDEQDIIDTYDERQQEQCRLYYQYLDIKRKNPKWGYKRIAKAMNHPIGKTRWWHANKHIPVPIQTANWLRKRDLLPLKIDNSKLPLIAKILGATFADGGIFENLNGIFLSSSEKEAVDEFGSDLIKICGCGVESNHRIIEGGIEGHSWCYQNTNRKIIRLFNALGAPIGNKTTIELVAPEWIKLNDVFEDEFYGSIFGGEIGISSSILCGARIEFGITGHINSNRPYFLNQIIDYLNRRGIKTTKKIYSYKRKTKDDNKIFRFVLSQRFENSQKFVNNVKINYCKYKKEKLIKATNEFKELKKINYEELIKRGYGAEHAMKTLNLTPDSLYFILNGEEIEI